jgi:hypothetical protein
VDAGLGNIAQGLAIFFSQKKIFFETEFHYVL